MVRNGKREPLNNDLIAGSDAGPNSGRGNGVADHPTDYAPDFIRREALQFIDQHAQEHFFLYLALNIPHANNEGGKGDFHRGMEVPDFGPFADREWPDAEKGFARMIQHIDETVADVLAKLSAHGIADNTLIVFSSDNGPHQEGGHSVDFFDSNGQLRGHKRDLYEGGIRVPMIARWPGHIEAGAINSQLSGFQDWMPTFCELAGVTPPSEHDGVSLVATLLGRPSEQSQHEALYFEFYEGGGKQAIVTDRWKCIRLNWNDQPAGPVELYDLQTDEAEQHDVAEMHPEIVRVMLERFQAAHTEHPGKNPPPQWGSKKRTSPSDDQRILQPN